MLLGAVPFPSDVLRLQKLGVCGVVTLNESYERLVPKPLYEVIAKSLIFDWSSTRVHGLCIVSRSLVCEFPIACMAPAYLVGGWSDDIV